MKTNIFAFALCLCIGSSVYAQAPHSGVDPKSSGKIQSKMETSSKTTDGHTTTTTTQEVSTECEISYLDYVFMAGKVLERTLEDMFPIPEADEMKYGEEMHDEVAKEFTFLSTSDARYKRILRIFNQLLPYRERKDINYTLYLIDDPAINAFSHAGGHVYITSGILTDLQNDDELALVLGHEISHVDKKHCIRHVQAQIGAQAAGDYAEVAAQVGSVISTPFGQYDEYEADWAGANIMTSAGYNPRKGLEVFRRWSANENTGDVMEKIFRTHPFSAERVCYLEMYVTEGIEKMRK